MIDQDDKLTFYYQARPQLKAFQLIKSLLEQREHDLVGHYDEFLIDIYLLIDNKKTKHIAIDWDNTVSADQGFFKNLIMQFQKSGYEPCICTLRAPDKENRDEIYAFLEETNIPIYFTDGRPKRKFLKKLGVKVHLWVDDFYPGICRDSSKLLARNNIQ